MREKNIVFFPSTAFKRMMKKTFRTIFQTGFTKDYETTLPYYTALNLPEDNIFLNYDVPQLLTA